MLPWKLRKRHILPASQNLLSVYFSLAKFQLVSCNLSLSMIWQRTYTHELPKLCSATLKDKGAFGGGSRGPRPLLFVPEKFFFCKRVLDGTSSFVLNYLNIFSLINIVNKRRICI